MDFEALYSTLTILMIKKYLIIDININILAKSQGYLFFNNDEQGLI